MALPGKVGALLAADMGKKGLVSDAPSPDDDDAGDAPASAEDDDSIQAIIDDIDGLVPGLGKLVHELVDRLQAEDEEQDSEDMG
jgi:hypothetical protein